ncbi:MAG: ABC-2 family transporter protein [Lentisphaerota bacterium]
MMLSSVRHHLSVAAAFARLEILAQLEYPIFLISWLVINPLHYFGGIWMLKVLVDSFQPIGGWTFAQVCFLYGLGMLSHGLMVLLFIQTWSIDQFVVQGDFDRLLLRPLDVFFQFCVARINFIGLTDLIPGIAIFAYGCRQVHFAWTLSSTAQMALVVAGAVLIRAALYTACGSIAFWTKRSGPLVGLNLALLERTTLYPLTIYPHALQVMLTFLIPVGFISFYPACDFVGQDARSALPLDVALWTPVVGATFFALAHGVFRWGLRCYESAGS